MKVAYDADVVARDSFGLLRAGLETGASHLKQFHNLRKTPLLTPLQRNRRLYRSIYRKIPNPHLSTNQHGSLRY